MTKHNPSIIAAAIFIAAFNVTPAFAYIGPGLGAGALGVIVGLVSSVLLAVFVLFWYPIKRMLKKKQTDNSTADANSNEENS